MSNKLFYPSDWEEINSAGTLRFVVLIYTKENPSPIVSTRLISAIEKINALDLDILKRYHRQEAYYELFRYILAHSPTLLTKQEHELLRDSNIL